MNCLQNICPYNYRITKEIEKLYKLHTDVVAETSIDNVTQHLVLHIFIKNNVYKFIIKKFYPFVVPTIFFNDVSYSNYLKLSSIRIMNNAKSLSNMECFCCHSFLCSDRWNPTISLNDIIIEITNFQKIKQMCYIKLLLDNIKTKYLIHDIDILSFLFV